MKYTCLTNFKDLEMVSPEYSPYLVAGMEYTGKHVEHFLTVGFIGAVPGNEPKRLEDAPQTEEAKPKRAKAKEDKTA